MVQSQTGRLFESRTMLDDILNQVDGPKILIDESRQFGSVQFYDKKNYEVLTPLPQP